MENIYKNDDSYFKRLKPVGHCTVLGHEHYALWIRMKKHRFLGITFFTKYGQPRFLLDMAGFNLI